MLTLHDCDDNGVVGNHQFVGISPECKRSGVGSMLFERMLEYAKSKGCYFLTSTTSVKAKSSIAWHKKNGFKIYRYASFRCTNYFSYVFRLDLREKSILRFWLPRKALLVATFVVTRLSQDENGNLTKIGQVLLKCKFLRRFCSY